MNDPEIIRANERLKAIAGILLQLGTALLAAAVVKMYYKAGFDLESLGWLTGAGAIIWSGWLLFGLLQPEDG